MRKLAVLAPLLLLAAGCASEPNQVAATSYECKLAPLTTARVGGPKEKASSIDQADARAQLLAMPYYQRGRMARSGAPYNLEDAAYGCR
jgi:hypothetical protein